MKFFAAVLSCNFCFVTAAKCAEELETKISHPQTSNTANAYSPVSAYDQAYKLVPGINIITGHKGFRIAYFSKLRELGYKSVRLPIFAFDRLGKGGNLDPKWLKSLDNIVSSALDANLQVILDVHDSKICGADITTCRRQLISVWSSLSYYFRNSPQELIFEILNEPQGQLDRENWEQLSSTILSIIRKHNRNRNVVIGPPHWNGIRALPGFAFPEDDHLIISVHYYEPFRFTHSRAQVAGSVVGSLPAVKFDGSKENIERIESDFQIISEWRSKNKHPVIIGEFGVCLRCGLAEDRKRWVAFVSYLANRKNIPYIYWAFDGPFGIFDYEKQQWDTEIIEAQISRETPP